MQHAPGRRCFNGTEHLNCVFPPVEEEIELIRFYGARTLAVALKEEDWGDAKMKSYQKELSDKLSIPVVRPLKEGVEKLLPSVREFIGVS